jgi:gamma-glutamyltranspeptidase/glutathione hydrolase
MQPQGHVQVLCNLIDFGMNVQEAGECPRMQHYGSATPTGHAAEKDGGLADAEPGIPDAVLADLAKRGHHMVRTKRNGGGYQGILIDPKTGVLHGGSEFRKDGCAVGY